MHLASRKIDRFFLVSFGILVIVGFVIFLSASLGLLAQNGVSFATVALKQAISLVLGIGAFVLFSRIDSANLRRYALIILAGAIIVNCLLFIPALTLHANGATRWLNLGPLTFQPSELLKIAFIIYSAAWLHYVKDRVKEIKSGFLPYLVMTGVLCVLLLMQRDTDTLLIIAFTGLIIFVVSGMPLKHTVLALVLMGMLVGGVLVFRPYALERVKTYINRGSDTQGSGYQINQSLIAIGSGQWTGRGFGQSIQKFGYLPQPTDDSIFAVAAEEFGFIGGFLLLSLYLAFIASVFRIGTRAHDLFGGLVTIGIGVLIATESFMNMAAMLGLIPLSGVPLLFISHGGTALIIAMAAAGIVANVSKGAKAT